MTTDKEKWAVRTRLQAALEALLIEHGDTVPPEVVGERAGEVEAEYGSVEAGLLDALVYGKRRTRFRVPFPSLRTEDPLAEMTALARQMRQDRRGLFGRVARSTGREGFADLERLIALEKTEGRALGAIAGLNVGAERLAAAESAASREDLLAALRERDAAQGKVRRMEVQLALLAPLHSEGEQAERMARGEGTERWRLLAHFRRRLVERFDVVLSIDRTFDLHDALLTVPVLGYTAKGTPVKLLQIEGREVFAVCTRDEDGILTPTTAYTEEMWKSKNPWAF